ncbi:MAG TPA: isoprenylcysteine carboxylmethyltransferase family protein [Methyloceanibacter sp.]|nr:isoprenylcysteine carboxylmethyltransferase family protein [Methyloceanibacter sp.]
MIAKLVRRTVISVLVMGLLLFVAAGTADWPSAWIFLVSQLLISLAGGVWLARKDPELLAERLKPLFQPGQQSWDRLVLVALITLGLSWFVVMGLDVRFGWSSVPVSVQILGASLLVPMAVLSYLTFRENRYAAPVVRVQTERGHRVISSGPYAYVRHPMYAGVIFFGLGVPLMLGALSGLIISGLTLVVVGIRAVLEERLLAAELPGYADYAERVRYRLVPLVW